MSKTIFFSMGLPRSGTTLIQAIMNQNPEMYWTPASPLVEYLSTANEKFFYEEQTLSFPPFEENTKTLISNMATQFYKNNNQKFIVDKCRNWGHPENIILIEKYITKKPKFVVFVRDVLEVLASYVKLLNQEGQDTKHFDSRVFFGNKKIDDARCDFLMAPGSFIEKSIFSIENVIKNNYDYILIDYNEFMLNPTKKINEIYNFLEVPYFLHDLTNIKTIDLQKNPNVGTKLFDLHTIRPTIKKESAPVELILSDYVIQKYKNIKVY